MNYQFSSRVTLTNIRYKSLEFGISDETLPSGGDHEKDTVCADKKRQKHKEWKCKSLL